MRVIYLVNLYPAVSHTFIRREIEALEALGHRIQRLSIRPSSGLVDTRDQQESARTKVLTALPVPVVLTMALRLLVRSPGRFLSTLASAARIASESRIKLWKVLAYFIEAILVVQFAKDFGADMLRVHFGTNAAVVARLARRLGGPPFIIAYHGPDEFDAPERWAIGDTVHESFASTAISSYCRAQLMRWTQPSDWDRIAIVRCGLDQDFLSSTPPPLPAGPLRLVSVARLSAQKGLFLLVEAIAAARDAGTQVHLDLVGDGPERARLLKVIAERRLEDVVHLHGALAGDGVRHVIASGHAFVLPSFAEGLPVVLMEALAMGRPVITTAINGIPELIRMNVNGWLIPAGDAAALAEAIQELAGTSLERLARMGLAGRDAVLANHDIGREAARLHELFTPRSDSIDHVRH